MSRQLVMIGGILGGVGVGAGLMYFLDPERGRRRRAGVRDKMVSLGNHATCAVDRVGGLSRDMRNRAYGMLAEAKGKLRSDDIDDEVLTARVRSKLGHKIGHPDWIEVRADHGCVTLSGMVPAAEADALQSCVSGVRGVREVASNVAIH